MQLHINGVDHAIPDAWRDETLLMVLREHLGLAGTKFGCGDGECGTCVVLFNGKPVRSCMMQAERAVGAEIETIEGLAEPDGRLHAVQQAWLDEHVAQCGFCQSGQILQAVALLRENREPDDAAIAARFGGNLCRCGTYDRIKRAIRRAATIMRAGARES